MCIHIRKDQANCRTERIELITGRTMGHDLLIYFLLTAIMCIILRFYHTNIALCDLLWQTYSMVWFFHHRPFGMLALLMMDNLLQIGNTKPEI